MSIKLQQLEKLAECMNYLDSATIENMNEIARTARLSPVLEVLRLVNEDGLTIQAACQSVGIPRSTYYHILGSDYEMVVAFQDILRGHQFAMVLRIVENQEALLDKLITEGLSDRTNFREKLALVKYLLARFEKLSQKVLESEQDFIDGSEYLKGPRLEKKQSRFVVSPIGIHES